MVCSLAGFSSITIPPWDELWDGLSRMVMTVPTVPTSTGDTPIDGRRKTQVQLYMEEEVH